MRPSGTAGTAPSLTGSPRRASLPFSSSANAPAKKSRERNWEPELDTGIVKSGTPAARRKEKEYPELGPTTKPPPSSRAHTSRSQIGRASCREGGKGSVSGGAGQRVTS